MKIRNFLPDQYEKTGALPINHNYLTQQFSDYEKIFTKLKNVVSVGDFTLGRHVDEFETNFAEMQQAKHGIGVGSGTDAILLSLKTIGIEPGDEVITTPFTFYATIGAIVTAGAKPVFADILPDYNINPAKISEKITEKTKAILPVHWSGKPCHMNEINSIAKKNNLKVIEDACHAVQASYKGKPAGILGDLGCFSFHPLKNLNVWGDGGIIITNNDDYADHLRLLRNHGLQGRDECSIFAYNSRLDTIQAIVASHLLQKLDDITHKRIDNAKVYDQYLAKVEEIYIPAREDYFKQVFHLYCIQCEDRGNLQQYLISKGIDAKVHYPIPMHLQPAAKYLGYKAGDFPVCENIAAKTLSLPVHEFLTESELLYVIETIKDFYA